ncbi:hypothetical protein [Paracoccus sediminicola]|uniref:hypothetical protein n=1 Tax=Paracoccus sediminicola TaxID=3017783 RepID=UPI0022F01102|nr:hypothetical protein [Paracoccus sediminicola]WBU56418.1 hypothetical protein PAF18_13205 [Paracoccus sediminicola]
MFRLTITAAVAAFLSLPVAAQEAKPVTPAPETAPETGAAPDSSLPADPAIPLPVLPMQGRDCNKSRQMTS